MEIKDTLLLPKTDFEMRGNLVKKDSIFIPKTLKNFYKINEAKKGKTFILHDGPPYANGNIHVGHALNKILKDILIRHQLLLGNKIDWKLGWDTHGLPIEHQIQKSGIDRKKTKLDAYLEATKNYALKQVSIQEEQFKKLNLFTDFNNKYLTLNNDYVKSQLEIFNAMFNKKLIYQDLKPVYWSWSSETSLSEAEIEYKDVEDDSIYLEFKLDKYSILIWTTTPWTIPANVALAFSKDLSYSVYKYKNKEIILSDALKNKIELIFNVSFKKISNFDIKNLISKNTFALNPLTKTKSKLVWGHHITTDNGTGIVHIAGGHGEDDYKIVKENKLDLIVVQNEKGIMQNSQNYDGLFYLKANKLIMEDLKTNIIFSKKIKHSIPVDWRTKDPVIYRATKQWFFSIKLIKDKMIKEISTVNWMPEWGKKRLIEMTKKRDDWSISRQRLWGVPLPIIYDENNNPIQNKELQNNIKNLILKEGIIGWHNVNIKDIIPGSIKYNKNFRKEKDILDVWFDSGSSHFALNIDQANVYLEGIDQFRGWFSSSMITSLVMKNKSPYKEVLIHGFVTDDKGRKMSKSLGNVIDPLKILEKNGSDILRLWVANSNYHDNVKISEELLSQTSKDYKKIRNTIKYILGNLNDFIENEEELKINSFSLISKSILNNIYNSWINIKKFYKENNFVLVVKEIMNQITSGSIAFLNEYSKDILYIQSEKSRERKEIQYILKKALDFILFNLAPIIPVTIEEAYLFLNKKTLEDNDITSFFTNTLPDYSILKNNESYLDFKKIKDIVNKEIELKKENNIIKRSQELELEITLPLDFKKWNLNNLNELLFVAKTNVTLDKNIENIIITSKKTSGIKCERCWKYFDTNIVNNNICISCSRIIKTLK